LRFQLRRLHFQLRRLLRNERSEVLDDSVSTIHARTVAKPSRSRITSFFAFTAESVHLVEAVRKRILFALSFLRKCTLRDDDCKIPAEPVNGYGNV
jgi:hypothetical protein